LAIPEQGKLLKKPVERSELKSDRMISGGMQRLLPADPEHPLKLSARSFSEMPTFQLPSSIWAKSVIPKPCGGLKTYLIGLRNPRPMDVVRV